MSDTKPELMPDEESILLPVAHGSGGFVQMRAVPAKGAQTEKAAAAPRNRTVLFPSRQYGAQVPRAQQMQSGIAPNAVVQMGD